MLWHRFFLKRFLDSLDYHQHLNFLFFFLKTDVMDVAWSPHDAWLASCSVDNTVVIWNAVKFPGENSYISDVQEHKGLWQTLPSMAVFHWLKISTWEWVVCLLRWHACNLASKSFFQVWMAVSSGFHSAVDNSCIQVVLLILHEGHYYMYVLFHLLRKIPSR